MTTLNVNDSRSLHYLVKKVAGEGVVSIRVLTGAGELASVRIQTHDQREVAVGGDTP